MMKIMPLGRSHQQPRIGIEDRTGGMRGRTTRVAALLSLAVAAWLSPLGALGGSGAASAATIYYVNGDPGIGKTTNSCLSPSSACLTIKQALTKAHSGDTVEVAGSDTNFNGIYCEEIAVSKTLTLMAQSATNRPTIDGGYATTNCAAGMAQHSVVTVGTASGGPMTVVLQGVIIEHGNAAANSPGAAGEGGGIYVLSGATLKLIDSALYSNSACAGSCTGPRGGGIYSGGTLSVVNSTLALNSACAGACGNFYSSEGGAIFAAGPMTTINDSSLYNNDGCTLTSASCEGYGGGVFTAGPTFLTNSTVAQNFACYDPQPPGQAVNCYGYGGGISSSANLQLTNSTVSGNTTCFGFSCGASGSGGGIQSSGGVSLANTIVAGNTDPSGTAPDCYGTLSDGSYSGLGTVGSNIIGNNTNCSLSAGPGNQVGTSTAPIDPGLDPLGSNGGPTETMALRSTSVARGAGNAALCQYNTSPENVNNLDQRASSRNAATRHSCDVGAYDTGSRIHIRLNWSLLHLPFFLTPGPLRNIAQSMDAQLRSSIAIRALGTFANGAFHLYVPGYSADQTLGSTQGLFVLSSVDGEWLPPGSAYTSSQQVSLQPGWNAVGVPYVSGSDPYGGLNGDTIYRALAGTCGLQETAIDVDGSYQVYTPSNGPHGTDFHVPNDVGMWIECTKAYTWTPS